MDIHVLKLIAIDINVDVVDWHSSLGDLFERTISKDRRFIHIVPCAVQVRSSVKVLQVVLVCPVLLSVRVQVIKPDRGSRPAVTDEIIYTIRLLNVNVGGVGCTLTCCVFS